MAYTGLPHVRREVRRSATRWLRDQLRAEAMRDAFPGGLLPGETELMGYGYSRAIVRDALNLLREEGIIERISGTGTFAVAHRHTVRMVEAHGFGEENKPAREGSTNRVVAMEVIAMPRIVAHYLKAEPGQDCLLYEYIGYLFGRTMGVYTHYVRFPEASRLLTTELRSDWHTLLRDAALDVEESELALEIVAADQYDADLLDMPVGAPLFGMRQIYTGPGNRSFGFALHRSPGDRSSWLTRAMNPETRLGSNVGT